MVDLYSGRRFDQRVSGDADQAEFAAILRGAAVTDSGVYDDRIAGALDDFDHETDEAVGSDWQRRDLQADSAVGGVQEELDRRSELLGEAYPFRLTGNQIVYEASDTKVYEFCLAVSIQKDLSSLPFAELTRVFERISAIIVERFLGNGSGSLHTGTPRDDDVGKRFDAAMKTLNRRTGEWIWHPEDDLPNEVAMNGDEGMDFVVWKRLGDSRQGQLFLTGQCACGDDWDEKFNDLDFDRLEKWFHPMARVRPTRAFTTPHFLVEGNLIEAQRRAGLVFDRARLTLISAPPPPYPALAAWRDRLGTLTQLVVK